MRDRSTRQAAVRAGSWNPNDRTIELVFLENEGLTRKTWDGTTYREVIPLAVGRFERFSGHASMFAEHMAHARSAIGVIQSWRLEDRDEGGQRGVCTVRLTESESDADIVGKIIEGTLPAVSVGYDVDGWTETIEDGLTVRTATGWEALEVAVVGIPADVGAHVRSMGDVEMSEKTAEIIDLCVKHGRADKASGYIREGKTIDEVRALILDELAAVDEKTQTDTRQGPNITMGRDEKTTMLRGFETALLSRHEGLAPAAAAEQVTTGSDAPAVVAASELFRGRFLAASRKLLARLGHDVSDLTNPQIAKLALSGRVEHMGRAIVTADLANLLTNVANKSLLKGRLSAESQYKQLARFSPAVDFRDKRPVEVGNFPALKEIPEGGAVEPGTLNDKIETYSIERRGRRISLTVQALANDDLSALTSLPASAGLRIEIDRDNYFFSKLALAFTSLKLADGTALCAAGHSNLGTAGVPSNTTLDEAIKLLGLMEDIDGTILSLKPWAIVVPEALAGTADRLVEAMYSPTTAATSQRGVIRGLKVFSSGVLDATSSTAWFMLPQISVGAAMEWTEVSGEEPKISTNYDWATDSLDLKATHTFGVGAVAHEYIIGNKGA